MFQVSQTLRTAHGRDSVVVLDIRHGQVFHLNAIGSLILTCLQQGKSESQIIDDMSQQFSISREIITNDINEFLKSMERAKLIYNDHAKGNADDPADK